nr:MAG TPA: hypothetical protein [Caudoviricetes sp.]
MQFFTLHLEPLLSLKTVQTIKTTFPYMMVL